MQMHGAVGVIEAATVEQAVFVFLKQHADPHRGGVQASPVHGVDGIGEKVPSGVVMAAPAEERARVLSGLLRPESRDKQLLSRGIVGQM